MIEVAREFADFFKDLEDNWASSDIAVGLILLKREQKMVRESLEAWKLIPEKYKPEQILPRWNRKLTEIMKRRASSTDAREVTPKDVPYSAPLGESKQIAFSRKGSTASNKATSNDTKHTQITIQPSELKAIQEDGEELAKVDQNSQVIVGENLVKSMVVLNHISARKSLESNLNSGKNIPSVPTKDEIKSVSHPEKSIQSAPIIVQSNENVLYPSPYQRGWTFVPSSNFRKASAHSILDIQLSEKVSQELTNITICDILHFSHYAEIAYLNFDIFELKKNEMVIFTSKYNDIFHIPYIVSYDHDWQSVVISMRGTFSAVDLLVDLKIDLEPLEEGNQILLAHSGILNYLLISIRYVKYC